MPPALVKIKGLTWLEDDHDCDARFWELYCAVGDTAPGPSEEWSLRGRSLSKSSAAIAPPVAPRRHASVRPSLRCDRAPQWKTVDDLATEGSNEIILLPGVVGQAHEHFLERIQRLLRMDPPRSVTSIDCRRGRTAGTIPRSARTRIGRVAGNAREEAGPRRPTRILYFYPLAACPLRR